MTIFEYMQLPDEKLNYAIASLILSKEIYPEINFEKYKKMIQEIAFRVSIYVQGRTDPNIKIAAINTTLYRDYNFKYDFTDFLGRKFENHMLSKVLDKRKGVCTSLPLLYLVIAEELNYPVFGVRAPDHSFCRYIFKKNGENISINIEATKNGGSSPDVMYIHDMKIPKKAYKNGVYLKTLTKREYISSLLRSNAVYYANIQNDVIKATKYFEEIIKWDKKNSRIHFFLEKTFLYFFNKNIKYLSFTREQIYLKHIAYKKNVMELGIAPSPPKDYWKQSFVKEIKPKKEKKIISKEKNGVIYEEDLTYIQEIKRLEVKYHDYFQ